MKEELFQIRGQSYLKWHKLELGLINPRLAVIFDLCCNILHMENRQSDHSVNDITFQMIADVGGDIRFIEGLLVQNVCVCSNLSVTVAVTGLQH